MKEKVYLAIDLNNAEEKEMPILSIKPTNKPRIVKNISIIFYVLEQFIISEIST